MGVTIFDGAMSCDQSLTDNLAAEYPLGALLGASSTKQIELDFFEIEKVEERVQVCRHWELRKSGALGRQGTRFFRSPSQGRGGAVAPESSAPGSCTGCNRV